MAYENPCPSCGSPEPRPHPAVQHEGEVRICNDQYHMGATPDLARVAAARTLSAESPELPKEPGT